MYDYFLLVSDHWDIHTRMSQEYHGNCVYTCVVPKHTHSYLWCMCVVCMDTFVCILKGSFTDYVGRNANLLLFSASFGMSS